MRIAILATNTIDKSVMLRKNVPKHPQAATAINRMALMM
jgi:hypothetical protein